MSKDILYRDMYKIVFLTAKCPIPLVCSQSNKEKNKKKTNLKQT